MGTRVINRESAVHYTWGGAQGTDCDGWHMVKTADLSVIEERMPAGTSEVRHSHVRTRQFFRVLEGELTLEIEGEEFLLREGDGIEIAPGLRHQALNRSAGQTRMLVVSQPHSHADRVLA
jgi:mannose-6-phosphate isomerase-like protein (cupin superfamily)